MKKVAITGAEGFIGKNLAVALQLTKDYEIIEYNRDTKEPLESVLNQADFVFHLAGINRPKEDGEFKSGNTDFTEEVIHVLQNKGKKTPILFSSSIQAELENEYGKSKRDAEKIISRYHEDTGANVYIFRLPNVFGKWSKPNYNSAVATFCHNITHDMPITVNDRSTKIKLAYIDDVIADFISCIERQISEKDIHSVSVTHDTTLGEVVDTLYDLHSMRKSLLVPNLSQGLNKSLYSTLISFYDEQDYAYSLTNNTDERGNLAEFIRSESSGQVFVSKTKPGFTRGNHWHQTKIEKFLVVDGEAEVSFRRVGSKDAFTYKVSGDKMKVIDIPVGYIHSIKNVGSSDMILVIWANEILDKNNPDTYYEEV